MPLSDRPYWREGQGPSWHGGGRGGLTFGLPKPSKAVKTLLIINVAVFVLQMFLDGSPDHVTPGRMSRLLGVTVGEFYQPWRYITFQFLHGGIWHILMNMLGLYFLGSPVEQKYGLRKFVVFYLSCGVTAGIAYVIIGSAGGLSPNTPIIGASGGVFGIILAAAVYFPGFRIIFLFFPVPIRLAALIIFGMMGLLVLQALGAGNVTSVMSDVAHLGGAVAAAVWVWGAPGLRGLKHTTAQKLNRGAWERKMKKRRAEQAEVDRILKKVHEQGLQSLSEKERRKLRAATERERQEDEQLR